MTISHPSQDFRARVRRVRIERDHLAPRVTVGDGDHGLRADLEPATEKRVLSETAHGRQVRVYVCPKAPLVQGEANFAANLLCCLYLKNRDRTAVGEGAV